MVIAARPMLTLVASTASKQNMLHSFRLEDTSGSGSSGFFRLGLAFEKSDIPEGSVPIAHAPNGTPVRSAIIERNSWSDGSMRKCLLVGEVEGGIDGGIDIDVLASEFDERVSNLDPFDYISTHTDLRVQVENHLGSVSGSLQDRNYDLNTVLRIKSRRVIQADTPISVRFFAWGHPPDEKHLMGLHYVDLWLRATGAVVGVEWTPVLSQHWWVDDPFGDGAQPKEERVYDALLVNGRDVLERYVGLRHAYYCRWAGLRTNDDAQHGRRLWINMGASQPTLSLSYSDISKRRMMRSGVFPPLKQGIKYNKTFRTRSIVPLGEQQEGQPFSQSHNHRRSINGTGGYQGRGILPNMDAIALTQQGVEDWRIARVSAQAGLSAFFHVRDHRVARGGPFDGDISMGLIPPVTGRLGPQSYAGLASETVAVTAGESWLKEDKPNGGTGAFSNWDTAHHVSYSFFVAFVEGEAYLADAVLSSFDTACIRRTHYNIYGKNPRIQFYETAKRRERFSLPDTRYGSNMARMGQERSPAWIVNAANHASILVADDDRHRVLVDNQIRNHSIWITDSMEFFPNDHVAKGGWRTDMNNVGSPWMNNFAPLSYYQLAIYADDRGLPGFRKFAEQTVRLAINMWRTPYAVGTYRDVRLFDADHLNYIPANETYRLVDKVRISENIATIPMPAGLSLYNNDIIIFSQRDGQGNDVENTIPHECKYSKRYYAINVNGNACNITESPNGDAIFLSDTLTSIGLFASAYHLTPAGAAGAHLPADDSFASIASAAAEMAHGSGNREIDGDLIAKIRHWMSKVRFNDYASWNYNGDMML